MSWFDKIHLTHRAERIVPKRHVDIKAEAWIAGAPASLDEAAAAAAELLGRSRQALIAGMGADIDGAKAVSYTHLTLPTNREV